ncbi:hypothetical protein [Aliamphritea spongicola]|nr:hypothetical protein [Aliamphritea spongicola]
MTLAVLAIALALPATLYTGLKNLQALSYGWQGIRALLCICRKMWMRSGQSSLAVNYYSGKMLLPPN